MRTDQFRELRRVRGLLQKHSELFLGGAPGRPWEVNRTTMDRPCWELEKIDDGDS